MTTMKDVPQLHHGGMLAFQVRFLTTAKRAAPTSYLERISSKAAQTTPPIFAASLTAARFTAKQFAGFTCRDTRCRDRFVIGFLDVCLVLVRPFQKLLFTDFGRECIIERENVTNACHTAPSLHGAVSLDYLFLGCHGRPY